MKILKVYDKINRTVFESDSNTGNVFIREYLQNDESCYFIINTKVFKSKRDKMAYFSYVRLKLGKVIETLDVTSKHIYYKSMNEKGLLVHSERIHLKDNKAILLVDRIYDEWDEFIEIENHRGNRTMKFKVKNEIINQLTNTK
jgi:hypothetical protein